MSTSANKTATSTFQQTQTPQSTITNSSRILKYSAIPLYSQVSSTQQSTSTISTPQNNNTITQFRSNTGKLLSLSTILSIITKQYPDNKIANVMDLTNTISETDICSVLETCYFYAKNTTLPSIIVLQKKQAGTINITYIQCLQIFSKILLTKDLNHKINFDFWLVNWHERMKCIMTFLLAIIKNDKTQHNKTFQIERIFVPVKNIKPFDFRNTAWIKPNVKHSAKKGNNNNFIQVLCTYPHMRKDVFNSMNELTNTRFLLSPECLLIFLCCESLDVESAECIVIKNVGEYSVTSFDNGKIKFEKPYPQPFDESKLSTVVLYAPLFNKILKRDKDVNYKDTPIYLNADLAKLIPIMTLYKDKDMTLAFNCCGCEKSKRDYSQLHFVEHWLMASLYKRKMIYFTNGNKKLKNAELLYDKVSILDVGTLYAILNSMTGISNEISYMQTFMWSTQIPVFKTIIKTYDEILNSNDKVGVLKNIYDAFKKNIDYI